MRMKKIMILAAVAIAAVACSRTYDIAPASDQAIGFNTWSDVMTKARATANDNTAFQSGDAFDIYGFKTVGSTNSVVFDGDDVTATVSGSSVTWDYTPHRFWDPAASSYTFFAVLPANQLATADAETGLFVSNDISFNDPTNFSNDILVADKNVVNGSSSTSSAPFSYTNPVQIQFNHVASSVDLFVKQDNKLGNAVVKVTALSLLKIHNSGHFTVSGYSSNIPTVTWDENSTPSTLNSGEYVVLDASSDSDDVPVTGKTTYDNHSASSTTGDAAAIFQGYVFMPQTISAGVQQIKLSYTIQVGSETPNVYTDVVIDIRDFMTTDTDNNSGTNITSWAPKTRYIYTMTIGANAIEFTASVKNWEATDVNGYQYLLN